MLCRPCNTVRFLTSFAVVLLSVSVLCGSASANHIPGHPGSPNGDLAFQRQDLDFILRQIKFAEDHVTNSANGVGEQDCAALLALLPNGSVPWGLRTVDGSCNNLLPGQGGFGASDLEFRALVEPVFDGAQILTQPFASNDAVGANTSYVTGNGKTVQDSTARLLSRLITNQSESNPAAVKAAADEDGTTLGPDITGVPQFLIPNRAPDEGLSAPFNAFMTFFGQFFDHGLDLINKGGNGLVFIPLAQDDPLYDKGPDGIAGTPDDGQGNFFVMTRATRDAGPDGLIGTDDDVAGILNATTPHVDQQQTYGSHASAQILLRAYEFGPCPADGPLTPPAAGCVQASGRLLNGFGNDKLLDTPDDGGMATWDTAQLQAASKLGLLLDDFDGASIPKILADVYGKFIPGPASGLPQLVIGENPDGSPMLLEGNLETPVDASGAVRAGHSFFLDVAHTANPGAFKGVGVEPDKAPDANTFINPRTDMLSGQPTRGVRAAGVPLASGQPTYDDELLGVHFICGDGRCNENIALTTVHSLFHAEHNRLVGVAQRGVLDERDLAFLNEWLDPASPATQADLDAWPELPFLISDASQGNQKAVIAAIDALGLEWNGERVFQIARFATEMQYNRIVFDEFVPTLSGLKDPFEGFHTNIDPAITSEFSQSVYRFGHSMLTQTVDRFDVNFETITDAGALDPTTASDQLGLFEAFLQPTALYNYDDATGLNTLTPEEGTGAVIRGLTRAVANQIDEMVTGGMQNNLVGLPLDIGAINIARGRDVGSPRLNPARRAFHLATQDAALTPYNSWMDYADNIRHEASLVNFIAGYGTHPLVAGADKIAGNGSAGEPIAVVDRRAAACALVSAIALVADYCGDSGFNAVAIPAAPIDAADFMRSHGDWAAGLDGLPITGLEQIDFWNGGLAEEVRPFTGHLGSTHNFVFENQMEFLQNGDRMYYVARTGTIPFFGALESNTFTSMVMRNTDLGEFGAGVLPLAIFSVPNHLLEIDQSQQFGQGTEPGDGTTADPTGEAALVQLVIRDPNNSTTNIRVPDATRFLQYTGGDHVAIGGTSGADTIIGGIGDDSLYGRDGNDRIEGGDGADHIEGGAGDDIITDLSGPDVIEGGPGNDAISSGNEEDIIFGDAGSDFIVNQSEFGEIFGGPGNDFIFDGYFLGHIRGGQDDDWMENLGGGEDLFQADMGAAPEAGEPSHKGDDVLVSRGGNNDADMENGDDIVVNGPGTDRVEGQLGFDWVSFQNDTEGVDVDIDLTIFLRPILPPSNATVNNRYDRIEGFSGSPLPDILKGTANSAGAEVGNELSISTNAAGVETTNGFALIAGLNSTATSFGIVPEVERKDQANDPVTGDTQFGWAGGEIILGGGGSDLISGEGGDDILDGDASLEVNIETPNPVTRLDPDNIASVVANAALEAAAAARGDALIDFVLSDALAQLSTDALSDLLLALTDQQFADILAVESAELTLASVQAEAIALQEAATLTIVQAAALQTFADSVAAAVTAAEVEVAARIADVTTNNQAVVAAQGALGVSISSLQAADMALADAQADVAAKEAAETSASQAAVTALLALINCGGASDPECADEDTAFDLAIAATVDAGVDVETANNVEAITAQAQALAAGFLASSQTTLNAAVAAAIADSDLIANAVVALNNAKLESSIANAAANAGTVATAAAQAAVTEALVAQASAQVVLALAVQAAGDTAFSIANAEGNAEQMHLNMAAAAGNLDLADLAYEQALVAFANAQAARPADVDARILVPSMQDVFEAVFAGVINPGELNISRIIAVHAEAVDGDTDSVRYQGNFADYTIEGLAGPDGIPGNMDDPVVDPLNPGAHIGDVHSRNAQEVVDAVTGDILVAAGSVNPALDGYIEIIDNRELPLNLGAERPGNDGRDLVRNVERLVFDDITVVLAAGAAGAAASNNSVAMGDATVTPDPAILGQVLTAALYGVTDADNIHIGDPDFVDNPTGAITGFVDYYWQAEGEPGSGLFTNIQRLGGVNANGDAYTPHGSTLEVTVDELGRLVRVEAIFLDDGGAFEIVHSAPVTVDCDPLLPCFVPGELLGLIPASYLGTPGDVLDALGAQDTLINPVYENASRAGGPRFDVSIANVPLSLFANTGFGAEILGGDEVLTGGFLLTFTDSDGNVTGVFQAEIVAITDLLTGLVDQNFVDVLFSIRGADVAGLVGSPFSIASLTVNGTEVANATFFGDSSVADATGVAVVLVNQSPAIANGVAVSTASFVGTAMALVEPFTFLNLSVGAPVFEFTIPEVDVVAFANTGFGDAITISESVYVGSGLTLRFEQAVPVPPANVTYTTGLSRPRLVAIVNPDGSVRQGAVDVVFTIGGSEAENLINGLTSAIVEVGGYGVAYEHERGLMFGDSLRAPEAVLAMTTVAQYIAATQFMDAYAGGDAAAIADATDALLEANLAALSQNLPGGPAADLQLAAVPHANFTGNVLDVNREINFMNGSKPLLPRLDFRLLDMELAQFVNNGFGNPVTAGDEILVDRIALMFTNPLAQVVGVFLPEIVANTDPATGIVDQVFVDLLWSIRRDDVLPLVVGLTQVTVTLDGVPVQTIQLDGNSRLNDAQGVAQVIGAAALQAANVLASAMIVGDLDATLAAEAGLASAMAAVVDSDADGVSDATDVCPFDASNDVDADGVCGAVDNCPLTSNAGQADSDFDGVGDTCDNCRFVPNGPALTDAGGNSQLDTDGDGFGNICDPDLNNDGVINFGDLVRFQAGWLGTEPDLDFNGDGVTNFGDLAIFSSYMFGEPGMSPAQ